MGTKKEPVKMCIRDSGGAHEDPGSGEEPDPAVGVHAGCGYSHRVPVSYTHLDVYKRQVPDHRLSAQQLH